MKIAVVGCGAVGSYYGARLAYANQHVHFLLRSDYEIVRRKGVFISSPQGDFRVQPRCARSPAEIGPCDLVIIALKTTANDEFQRLLPDLVSPQTALLTLQNGLGNEEKLAALFRPQQIIGGLCFVCLNRIEPGSIRHLDHGLVVLGEFQGYPEPRTHDIAGMFRAAGVPCKVTDNLARAHWEKLVWNIPFNGLGVASAAGYEPLVDHGETSEAPGPLAECLTTDRLLSDARWERLVRELMLEVIRVGRALDFDIPDSLADNYIERTRTMGAYKASTLIDFERGLPLELQSLFLQPLGHAERTRVPVPRLKRLCHVLASLDPGRRNL